MSPKAHRTVTAVGEGAGFIVGNRVAALSEGVDRALGAYAEEVVVPAAAAALVPEGLSLTDAATVPLNALTAHRPSTYSATATAGHC